MTLIPLTIGWMTGVASARATNGANAMKVTDEMVNRFLGWRFPDDLQPDGGIVFNRTMANGKPRPAEWWPVGTNLLTADQARAMLEHVLGEGSYEQFRDDYDAAVLFERAAHHLMEVMQAFERRVRSECTPEQIEKRPWECAEYLRAATFLRRAWKDAPVTGTFVGSAWLIELDDPLGNVQYYCGPGDWCNSPNHAKKFPSEQAARQSRDWYEMLSPQNMRIAEHIWGNHAND